MASSTSSTTRRPASSPVRWLTPWIAAALLTALAGSCSKATGSVASTGAGGDTAGVTSASSSTSASSTASAGGAGGTAAACGDCTAVPNKPICDDATGTCVECTPAEDVCAPGQYCVEATLSCEVGCTDDSDCTTATHCNTDAHTCVGCAVDNNCPAGSICSAGVCLPGCNGTQPCQVGMSCCTATCVDVSTDVDNCGLCNGPCPDKPHAVPSCLEGACEYDCAPGWSDCNENDMDGCEHNTLQDGPCTCSPLAVSSCYLGAPNTENVGPCKAGEKVCDQSGLLWGPCVNAVFPVGEVCNMIDDDCNGVVDNACVPSDGTCAAEEMAADNFPVDIIWVVDDSGSMSEELNQIESNINNQFTNIIAASGLDYRVAVIVDKGTGSYQICVNPPLAGPNCGDNLPTFRAIDEDVQSWDSLTKTLSTYDNANPTLNWSTFVRQDAFKVFIEVSDDNSNPMQAIDFDTQLLAKNPPLMFGTAQARKYIYHSIIGIVNGSPNQTCSTAVNTGQVYQDLSALTGGMVFSVCENDYSPIFNAIANNVVLLSCEYQIPQPMNGVIDYGKVNVEYTPGGGNPSVIFAVNDLSACDPITGGWYYDSANPTKIILCPATCDQVVADSNGTMKILVGCATIHQ